MFSTTFVPTLQASKAHPSTSLYCDRVVLYLVDPTSFGVYPLGLLSMGRLLLLLFDLGLRIGLPCSRI